MSLKDFARSFVRQGVIALGWFTGLLFAVERLSPGSILPYLNIFLLLLLLIVLLCGLTWFDRTKRSFFSVAVFLPIIFLLLAFLFFSLNGMGLWQFVLMTAGVIVLFAVMVSIAYPEKISYE